MHQAHGGPPHGSRAGRPGGPGPVISQSITPSIGAMSSSAPTPVPSSTPAVNKAFVAFEVDWVEPTWQTGWSVVVHGQAHLVTDPDELVRMRRLPLLPWAEGEKSNFVNIRSTLISGRRLGD